MPIPGRLAAVVCAVSLVCLVGCSSRTGGISGFRSSATIAPPSEQDLSEVVSAARSTLGSSSAISVRLDSAAVFGGAPKPIGGGGLFDFGASRGQVELSRPIGTERVIFFPESVFVAQPQHGALLPAGKVWISAGLTEQSLATNFPQFVTQVESLNPGLLLSEVEWGATSAAPIGYGANPGSRQFSVSVDLAKAQSEAAGPSGDAFRRAIGYQLIEMSGTSVPTQITVDVEIDLGGKVVLLRSSPAGAGLGTVTVVLSQFGAKVNVGQPPGATVADISSLAPGGERENAGGGDSDGA